MATVSKYLTAHYAKNTIRSTRTITTRLRNLLSRPRRTHARAPTIMPSTTGRPPGVFGVFRTFPYRNSRTRSKRRANCPSRISAEQIYVRFSKIDRPKQERYGRRCSRLLSSSRDFSCNAAVFYFFVDALRRKPMTIVF